MTCIVALVLLQISSPNAASQKDIVTTRQPEAAIRGALDALSNLAMKEEISRYRAVGGESGPLDSIEAEVSVVNGAEEYSRVRSRDRTYRHISEIHGLWSVGELFTMLRTTRDILRNSRAISTQKTDDSTIVWFHTPAEDNRWFIMVGKKVYWLGFTGAIRISSGTGELLSLTWRSAMGPPGSGVAGISWEVNFQPTNVSGQTDTLPASSLYRVVRSGRRGYAEWNQTRFTVLGRYGSTSLVRFGD